jgi:hypothetical protein
VGALKYSIKPLEWNANAQGSGQWWTETPFGTVSVYSAGSRAGLNGVRRECFIISTKSQVFGLAARRQRNFRSAAEAKKAVQAMFEAQLSQWLEAEGA